MGHGPALGETKVGTDADRGHRGILSSLAYPAPDHSQWAGPFNINQQSRKGPMGLPTEQSEGGNPSSHVTVVCVRLTERETQPAHISPQVSGQLSLNWVYFP